MKETINWEQQPLGEISDYKLAKQLGVSQSLVRRKRAAMNIAPYLVRGHIDWDAQPLGEMSDYELADLLGVSHTTVQNQRRKRKIPPFNSKNN